MNKFGWTNNWTHLVPCNNNRRTKPINESHGLHFLISSQQCLALGVWSVSISKMENRNRISTILAILSILVLGFGILAQETKKKELYLNDGVEFVFPTGVHYILANVYARLWPVETTNIEHVLESDDKKLVVNFATVLNTLKLVRFNAML